MPARSSLSDALAGRLAALASVPRSTEVGSVLKLISKIASIFLDLLISFRFGCAGSSWPQGLSVTCLEHGL